VQQPPVGRHDRRERRDQRQRVALGLIAAGVAAAREAQRAGRHPQRIHRIGLGGCGSFQQLQRRRGQRAQRAQLLAKCGELLGVGQRIMPQQIDRLLEGRMQRQLLHRKPGDDQLARLAIDAAEPRLCGHDPFQARRKCWCRRHI
jgi:hypothetical protein